MATQTLNRKATSLLAFPDNVLDAFGQPISVQPEPIIDIKHIDSFNKSLIEEIKENGGETILNLDKASVDLIVNTTVGSRVVRQTKRYFPYQSGRAFGMVFTVNLQ